MRSLPFFLFPLTLFSLNYSETLYPEWGQWLENSQTIHEEKTDQQHLIIFENSRFGRVLALDGAIQTTTSDEAVYHEMMVHVPLLAHDNPKSILIIGGGDGGILREALRHPSVQRAVLVEIDATVIERSKTYLPSLSNGAFSDPRTEIVIADGAKYVEGCKETFDIILCDSTDPKGPGKVLFTDKFYSSCKKLLKKNGIFVNQNGVPFLQKEELAMTAKNRKNHFKHITYYVAPVPTYVGGFMAFGWASDKNYRISAQSLAKKLAKLTGKMVYYTPHIHKAAFTLPQFMLDQL